MSTYNDRLIRAARKNLHSASLERRQELESLAKEYDAACELSELPDRKRAIHWSIKADRLEIRIREFAAVTDKQMAAVILPKKENRFAEST